MIIGLPGEEEDVVEKTWEFIKEVNPEQVMLSLLSVRPGTAMYNYPEKFGMEWVTHDWKKTMHLFSRYENEKPQLSFRYKKDAFWGKSLTNEQIVDNYLELQKRVKENGYGPL